MNNATQPARMMLYLLGISGMGIACDEARAPIGEPICIAWKGEVSALVQDNCVQCHGADVQEGSYALDDYVHALAVDASGQARVVPGSDTSKILTIFDADATHGGLQSVRPALTQWVVDCEARFLKTELHAAGIMAVGHPDFHGTLVRENLYDLDACRQCHGEDLTGGGAEASCISCHPAGPDDCSTCHADLQDQGAHRIHIVGGALQRPATCQTCHLMPTTLLSPGHVLTREGALDPPPVEVTLSLDAIGPGPEDAAPTFDPATQRCNNVYCHGGTFTDTAAQQSAPLWTGQGPLQCNNCHGQPPSEHPGQDCVRCHLPAVTADNQIADLALHLDRTVQLGPPELGCWGCHGSPNNPAPAPDLQGRTEISEVTVGLHDAHLFPRYGLGAALQCVDCHIMPTDVRDFGHLDAAPAEVFPPRAGVGVLASSDGAMPVWDRETATCQDVYCHGGGEQMGLDTSPDLLRAPVWTDPVTQQVYCGSCHGVPPTTAIHTGFTTLDSCVMCHSTTVDTFGNIIPNGDHLNGRFTR